MQFYINIKAVKVVGIATCLIFFISCKKFLDIPPPRTDLIKSTVFQSDETAIAALLGIYTQIMTDNTQTGGFSLYPALSSDELVYHGSDINRDEFFLNELQETNFLIENVWSSYQTIYRCNVVLEGVESATAMTPLLRQRMQGEAKFMRAFCHFYLTNFFGDVPYITTTDYSANLAVPRMPVSAVYSHIIQDLKEAESLLGEEYVNASNVSITTDRARPNKSAARAFLARMYLYTKNYPAAEEEATKVIDNTTYSLVTNLDAVFLRNSKETIFQLLPVIPNNNTWEAAAFIINNATNYFALNDSLLNAFEEGDNRKVSWLASTLIANKTYYYPHKYRVRSAAAVTECSSVFRLAELYLIRAEARINQSGKISSGIDDLNILRRRSRASATALMPNPLPDLSGSLSQPQALLAVEQERRVELFTEWGHRWFDLKRTGRVDQVLATIKTGWQSTDQLYPLPQSQLANSPGMNQNDGYKKK